MRNKSSVSCLKPTAEWQTALRLRNLLLTACLYLSATSIAQVEKAYEDGEIIPVRIITDVNMFQEDNHWVSMLAASNGRIYFGLTCHGCAAGFYEYDPVADKVNHIASMDDATKQHSPHMEPHSKIHGQIREDKHGNIWFGSDMGTHFYGQKWDVPDGYPGGHLFRFDPVSRELCDLGVPFPRGALRVLEMDPEREMLYIVTFPDGRFYTYDMNTHEKCFKGRVNNNDAIARAMAIDDQGNIYGSFNPYGIFKYSPEIDKLEDLPVTLPHLEPWCDKGHYRREDVWRKAVWHPEERVFYGLEEGSAVLFRFDPAGNTVEDLGQLTIEELYGERIVPSTPYAFAWHERLEKFLYAAPRPRYPDRYQPRHLVSYDPETGKKTDHGPMIDPGNKAEPYYLEGMVVDADGMIYICGKVAVPGTDPREKDILSIVILDPEHLK